MSFEKLQQEDPWFYSHYVYAASIVATRLRKYIKLPQSRLFDLGCGDGIMALGVSHAEVTSRVTGGNLKRCGKA